jgi:hypothetical protein
LPRARVTSCAIDRAFFFWHSSLVILVNRSFDIHQPLRIGRYSFGIAANNPLMSVATAAIYLRFPKKTEHFSGSEFVLTVSQIERPAPDL